MRQAQTEYESCVDVYQLRIKTLNKVKSSEWSLETVRWVTSDHLAAVLHWPCSRVTVTTFGNIWPLHSQWKYVNCLNLGYIRSTFPSSNYKSYTFPHLQIQIEINTHTDTVFK